MSKPVKQVPASRRRFIKSTGASAAAEFSASAKRVLARRIDNSPPIAACSEWAASRIGRLPNSNSNPARRGRPGGRERTTTRGRRPGCLPRRRIDHPLGETATSRNDGGRRYHQRHPRQRQEGQPGERQQSEKHRGDREHVRP